MNESHPQAAINNTTSYYLSMFLSLCSVTVSYLGIVWQNRGLQFCGILLLAINVGIMIDNLIDIQKQEKRETTMPQVVVEKKEPQPVLVLVDRVEKVLRLGAGAYVNVNTTLSDRSILDIKSASGKLAVGIVLLTDKSIGISAVRGLHSLVTNTNMERGFLFTSGTFTEEAVKWAKGKPVFLIDGQSLEQMAKKYEA